MLNDIDFADLYQEVIVDHSRRPRNFGRLDAATHSAEGFNPLCGDRLKLYVNVKDDAVQEARFEGDGCAISRAAASLMTESIKGKSKKDVLRLFSEFRNLATGVEGSDQKTLGNLTVFSGLAGFPARVKCATLAWHTLRAALEKDTSVVSTE
jgi:nitrogen fixation protein NifU and related proteins